MWNPQMNTHRPARAQVRVNQVAPGLPFGGGHAFPVLRVCEKLLTLFNAEAGEFIERFEALDSLFLGQVHERS